RHRESRQTACESVRHHCSEAAAAHRLPRRRDRSARRLRPHRRARNRVAVRNRRLKLLLDTHLLLSAAGASDRFSARAKRQLNDQRNELLFSAVSMWEIAIKSGLGRDDFRVEPRVLRRALLDNGYLELPITSEHTVNIDALAPIHKDPF